MGKYNSSYRVLIAVLLSLMCVVFVEGVDHPQYQVVRVESDFEVRLYGESVWMSAPVTSQISFQKATFDGFHRLFQYIQGANQNWTRIPMTSPVLTNIVRGAGPFNSTAYSVQFYLPENFQDDPPLPYPEMNLKPYEWKSRCVAVRKFPGFATDDNIVKEAHKLASSLSKSNLSNSTISNSDFAYSIAQYDAPFQIIARVNEVWADVDACDSGEVAPN